VRDGQKRPAYRVFRASMDPRGLLRKETEPSVRKKEKTGHPHGKKGGTGEKRDRADREGLFSLIGGEKRRWRGGEGEQPRST